MKIKKEIKIDETNINLETVVNNCVYSTTEQKIGKWIDGKPIYRKKVSLEARTTAQSFPISAISSNIDKIWIDSSASFYGSGGIISDWEITNGRFRITIDAGRIYYICNSLTYKNGTITFNYTKTTD